MSYSFSPIGYLQSPFREKFGVPRQSLMMSEASAVLKLLPEPSFRDALTGLEEFSHIWILFIFHKNAVRSWHPWIDTPRHDEAKKVGVFATRSPHRPNPVGLSAVILERIDYQAKGGIELHIRGVDLLDGTPVLDVKPYLPYADCLTEANSGWIKKPIERYRVRFSDESLKVIEAVGQSRHPRLRQLIEQMLELDPRPTSQRRAAPIADVRTESMRFAFRVMDVDVRWHVRDGMIIVYEAVDLGEKENSAPQPS